jgi:2-polyprenyl-6-methoxyphenol hydroxylase-like FAD-dependent oxidoreductase
MDPRDYGLIGRINHAKEGKPALWRVSYGVPLGVSEEEIRENVDDKLRVMMPNGGRNEAGEVAYEVVRIAPYKAQQRLASALYDRESRVCLVGDAAHLTNPYAGLGLASGMADASSLSEVLIRILTGQAADAETLLGSWSEARRKKFLEVVVKDPLVGALKKGMPVQPPSLETKGEDLLGW